MKKEIVYQIDKNHCFQRLIYDIEIWYDGGVNGKLELLNKKWLNNEAYRPHQLTNFNNLFLPGLIQNYN